MVSPKKDVENNVVEEDSSSDVEFACGDPQVEPRVGDEFQAEIPPMMSASKRKLFLSTNLASDDNDSSYSFLIGRPVQVMWMDKHQHRDDDYVDMNQSLKSLKSKRRHRPTKARGKSLEAVPEMVSSSWDDLEVDSFVLGLYTFGKNFTQITRFMEKKTTGEILLFYYSKFYNSSKYKIWFNSHKNKSRRCVSGRKLFSSWRQQLLLSRLIPSITNESQRQMLVNISKSFAEGNITLEKYVTAMKDLVGLKVLVEAVAIGKDKQEDLTVLSSAGPVKTKSWFTLSPKHSSVQSVGAYASLSASEIVNQLTGCSRLSKARCSDIFWEAVWPRLLARGWHSEQIEERGYFATKDNIVYIVPCVKRFSRGKHVKGEHYFDSVSEILTKVALEPELLELETEGEIREVGNNGEENSSDQSGEESSSTQRHCYLKSPCTNRGSKEMKFTVVDTTSSASGGELCGLRNLKAENIVKEETLEKKVDEPLKRSVKSKFTRGGGEETDYHSGNSAPLLKRRRLSACIRKEESLSRGEIPVFKHLPCDDTERTVCPEESNHLSLFTDEDKERDETMLEVDYTNLRSDQSIKTETGLSETKPEEIRTASELNPLEQEPNKLSSVSDSDKKHASNDLEPEDVVVVPSISGSNLNSSSEQQQQQELDQQIKTDGTRRQSSRKRPMSTRALEAIESGFLTTKKVKSSTPKPRNRQSSRKKEEHSAKACDRAQVPSDNGSEEGSTFAKKATASKPLDQIVDSKPSFILNEAAEATESKAPDPMQVSTPVLTEHTKLPPFVLKLSRKRG